LGFASFSLIVSPSYRSALSPQRGRLFREPVKFTTLGLPAMLSGNEIREPIRSCPDPHGWQMSYAGDWVTRFDQAAW
jgi:hypothetical protein